MFGWLYLSSLKQKRKYMKNLNNTKPFTFTIEFQDCNENELKRENITAFSEEEAETICAKMLAECVINDCVRIIIL